jgi:hypothetical protein
LIFRIPKTFWGEKKMNNWKTTVFGLGAGVLNLFANGTNWKQVLFSVATAGLGILAKDFNVSGVTKP